MHEASIKESEEAKSEGHSESREQTPPPQSHYQAQFANRLAMFDSRPRVGFIPVCGAKGGGGR